MNTLSQVALVTGSNKGIGFEVCRQLVRKNIQVLLTALLAASLGTEKRLSGKTPAGYPLMKAPWENQYRKDDQTIHRAREL